MPKCVLQGVIVSDKQNKTVVEKAERRFTHPVMKKTMRRTKKYHAHDENNSARVGDTVLIQESRPYSKLKTWELVSGGTGGEAQQGSGLLGKVKSLVGL